MKIMTHHVRPGTVAYDLGANYGMHTLLLARLAGPSGQIFAFEPDPEVLEALNGQITLNEFHSVRTFPLAVSDRVGTATFDRGDSLAVGHLVDSQSSAAGSKFEVQTTTLDEFVLKEGNPPPAFIKIDIEGAESAALRGAAELIRLHRPVLMVELHNPTEDRACGLLLKQFRYSAVRTENGDPVRNMESGWPDPQGMHGTILAIPNA